MGRYTYDIAAEDDGRRIRPVGPWTKVKLEVADRYLFEMPRITATGFGWQFADSCSGPGLNRVDPWGDIIMGSPLLAMRARPQAAAAVFIDASKRNVNALRERLGEQATIVHGDCNEKLLEAMYFTFDRRRMTFVLHDPSGYQVKWQTVKEVSEFRQGSYKAEQLILFASGMGVMRIANDPRATETQLRRIDDLYGHQDWRLIRQMRLAGSMSAAEARESYVSIYAEGLTAPSPHGLGYKYAPITPISKGGDRGCPLYHLVFATDNPVARDIVEHIMDIARRPDQSPLFRWPRQESS